MLPGTTQAQQYQGEIVLHPAVQVDPSYFKYIDTCSNTLADYTCSLVVFSCIHQSILHQSAKLTSLPKFHAIIMVYDVGVNESIENLHVQPVLQAPVQKLRPWMRFNYWCSTKQATKGHSHSVLLHLRALVLQLQLANPAPGFVLRRLSAFPQQILNELIS